MMTETQHPVIRFHDVVFGYDDAELVLDQVSFQVRPGQRLALLGRSGSGKSTVIRLLLGLDAPHSGRIDLRGSIVSDGRRIIVDPTKRNLAVVFQSLALWPHMTVRGNLEFGLKARSIAAEERRERIRRMLRRVGLADAADRHPSELSGGERQRVAIARALVVEPDAVLLDEPLSNLDVVLKQDLLAQFSELFAESRSTVLYVTHDPAEAMRIVTDLCVLDDRHIVFSGQRLPDDSENPFVAGLVRSSHFGA
ncbi:MAG: ABC transporter ATP-binding protein [Deltaproteobacteria bacterium]|nr:ABC transporter ATP-binding protein [Deltaproteobacteria bacterium]